MYKILVTDTDHRPDLVLSKFEFVTKTCPNISLALQHESEFSSNLKREMMAKGVPIIGLPRFDKIDQIQILERYKIPYPDSYYDINTNGCLNTTDKLNSYCDLDEFVVKPINGARGIGVKLIKRQDYKDCLYSKTNTEKVFHKEIEEAVSQDPESYQMKTYIQDSIDCMLIQKPINVRKEFRILYFTPNEVLGYERERSEGQFCGNLSHGSKPKRINEVYFEEILKPFINKFKPIMDEFRYPWLSIDVYEDDNGDLGVFEFQMEFAYEGFDHKLIRESMAKSLQHFIKL